jgi:hypothetical protein
VITSILTNVFVRLAIYAASSVPGLFAAWGIGWINVAFDGSDWLTIQFSLQGIAAMLASTVGLTGGIFAKFGTR